MRISLISKSPTADEPRLFSPSAAAQIARFIDRRHRTEDVSSLRELFAKIKDRGWIRIEEDDGGTKDYAVVQREGLFHTRLLTHTRGPSLGGAWEILPRPDRDASLDVVADWAGLSGNVTEIPSGGGSHSYVRKRRLGGLLRELMGLSGCCEWGAVHRAVSPADLVRLLERYQLALGISAARFSVFARSRTSFRRLKRRLVSSKEEWPNSARLHGLVLALVIHHGDDFVLVWPTRERWKIHGRLRRPGMPRSVGPYLGIFSFAQLTPRGHEFGLIDGFLQPIFETNHWLPVDSNLEREICRRLICSCEGLARDGAAVAFTKPLFDDAVPGVLFDFIIVGAKIGFVEVLGFEDPSYRGRKNDGAKIIRAAGHETLLIDGTCRAVLANWAREIIGLNDFVDRIARG